MFGLYDSPRCAGIAEPAKNPALAPRQCRTDHGAGHWVWKRKYRSESEIPRLLREDPSTRWYWCDHCGCLHIGHTRMGQAEKFRMFRDPADLADFLVKSRGEATRAQVADVAGIRPIRLKELEEPAKNLRVDIGALFEVARVLGFQFGVAINPDEKRSMKRKGTI